jgi:glycerol-3-phosphate dehydrogenase (NAD(P)+)
MNVSILGAGSWGIALSAMLSVKGVNVRMWEINENDAAMLRNKREHPLKLPGIIIPENVVITSDIAAACAGAEHMVCVVPAQVTRKALQILVKSVSPESLNSVKSFVIASKGVECGTLNLLSEVLKNEIPGLDDSRIVVLSGPSHAEEVSRKIPTTVVAASLNNDLAIDIQNAFSTAFFRIYTNNDVKGVQLCASIKNVIAIAAGICDGLGFGDNTKGALLTRGMVEMCRLGLSMGAQKETFYGLAGFGDLITTCISRHSRNRKMGELIASGIGLEKALGQMIMVAEGVETTRSIYSLADKQGVEMPITIEVYKALFEDKSPKAAVQDLMMRQVRPE